jgi:hypothetical protein
VKGSRMIDKRNLVCAPWCLVPTYSVQNTTPYLEENFRGSRDCLEKRAHRGEIRLTAKIANTNFCERLSIKLGRRNGLSCFEICSATCGKIFDAMWTVR